MGVDHGHVGGVHLVKIKVVILGFRPDHPLRIVVMALPDQLPRAEWEALVPVFLWLIEMSV